MVHVIYLPSQKRKMRTTSTSIEIMKGGVRVKWIGEGLAFLTPGGRISARLEAFGVLYFKRRVKEGSKEEEGVVVVDAAERSLVRTGGD